METLAEQTGLSKSALSKYESDDVTDLSIYAVTTLAEFYGVTTDYLLGVTENKKRPDAVLSDCLLYTSGPSSSHTAGAARIGYTAQKLLGEIPAQADIGLYGSFATTGKGHGTDKALVAGLLGLRPDDPRLPDSFALARSEEQTSELQSQR